MKSTPRNGKAISARSPARNAAFRAEGPVYSLHTTWESRAGGLGVCATAEGVPFDSFYTGTFHVSFGTGSGGNHQLSFHGNGLARHLGASSVDGTSEMAPGSAPNCTQIVNDSVTLTGANGDTLLLVNSGEDCIFVEDGGLVIRGTGVMQIVGGTGRFAGATGLGTWVVAAPVTSQTAFPPGADGTFELRFTGRLHLGN